MNNSNRVYSGHQELIDTEKYLCGYNDYIVQKFIEYSLNSIKILDFGAGIGTLSKIFYNKSKKKPICLEIDELQKKILIDQGFKVIDSLSKIESLGIDFIYSSNVLEHIEDDEEIINLFYKYLPVNGKLCLYLPALMNLWSEMDDKVGHFRRYEKKELIKKVSNAGFKIIECNYCDTLGFFASRLIKMIGYKNKAGVGSPKSLMIYDRVVFPISKILDNIGFKKIFGKNLIIYAVKS